MKLLLPGDISTFADSVVVTLRNSQIWVDALVGAKLDPDPAPVQRLDDDDDIYYIVTLTKSQGITARIAIAGNVSRLWKSKGFRIRGNFWSNPSTARCSEGGCQNTHHLRRPFFAPRWWDATPCSSGDRVANRSRGFSHSGL